MAMKNRKVLALSVSAVLAISFLTPSIINAQAQVSSESRVLNTILALTQDSNKDAQRVNSNLDTINDDLLLKQKFWQLSFDTTGQFVLIGVFGSCEFADDSACAFNVESAQFDGSGFVSGIFVDGVFTDVRNKDISASTNLLVDSGAGKIGANEFVAVLFDEEDSYSGDVEFNGEKPQGMSLIMVLSSSAVEDTGNCFGFGGPVDCPPAVKGYVAEAKLKNA
jgi:hypothetical protein